MTSMIKRCLLLVTVFVFIFVLCGCSSEPDARGVYEDYLELAEVSLSAAINKYCHYERIEIYHMSWDTPEYMISHEILSWEQISDNLWAAKIRYTSSFDGIVTEGTNFVGLIQGTYKIFISVEEIPYFLTEGLDLEEYYQERENTPDKVEMYI